MKALTAGKSYIKQIAETRIAALSKNGRFSATTDFTRIKEADAILICVPTPLSKHLESDMTYVEATTRSIAPHVRKGQLIVLESTTYPGTTRDLMRPILEKGSGLKANADFFLAYSPEREDPGARPYDALHRARRPDQPQYAGPRRQSPQGCLERALREGARGPRLFRSNLPRPSRCGRSASTFSIACGPAARPARTVGRARACYRCSRKRPRRCCGLDRRSQRMGSRRPWPSRPQRSPRESA